MPTTPVTPQTKVNTTVAGAQFAPAVTALEGGGYVVVWLDFSSGHVFGQLYDGSGQTVGSQLDLGDQQGGSPIYASAAPTPGGGFVVAWQAGSFDFAEIYAQRFDSAGNKSGALFQVNATMPNEQLNPHVVALANGALLFTWDTLAGGAYQEVRGRLFDNLGQPQAPDFQVNTTTADAQGVSALAALTGGGFVVTWQSVTPAGGSNVEIIGQRFSNAGGKVGGEFQVNTTTAGTQFGNDVAGLSDGGFVVTWIDGVGGSSASRVLARHYDASGNALGGEIVIATKATGGFGSTVVSALANGAYVVSWTDDDSADNNVSARAMGANDVPLGDAFDISAGSPFASSLYSDGAATLANGRIVFAWDGPSTNTGQDIYSRVYEITGSAPPSDGGPGPDTIDGGAGNDALNGNGGNDTLNGAGGDDTLDGGAGNDALNSGTGVDTLRGGADNDSLYFGGNLTNADTADGGDGTDSLIVQGNYPALTLPATPGVEVLLVASGSDNRFGDLAGNSYDYAIAATDANVPAGGILTVMATGLLAGEDLVFNGSGETNGGYRIFAGRGTDSLTGGGGSDGFFFGADGNLTGADTVQGGAGIDTLALRGNYTLVFQNGSFGGIEVLALLSGLTNEYGGPIAAGGYDYNLTLADGNIAAGQRLDVNAVRLAASESVALDARAETNGSVRILAGAGDDSLFGSANADIIYGGLGADAIDGSGGADLYLYRRALESTAAARDTIAFGAGDKIDLSFIDAVAGTAGVNDAFAFIGDTAFSAAGQLRAFQSGNQWIVEGDVNGDGTADLAIAINGAASIAAADFVL